MRHTLTAVDGVVIRPGAAADVRRRAYARSVSRGLQPPDQLV